MNETSIELPVYQSIKKVWGLKISKIEPLPTSGIRLSFYEQGYAPIIMTADEMHKKPTPEINWYYVKYKDGYVSFSPEKAFEEGHDKI
jgi:hypothetical protein